MKLVRNLAAALLLSCALTVNVYAGDQPSPAYVPPPPPATASDSDSVTVKDSSSSETDGKVATEETEQPEDLLVSALLAILSIF